MAMTDINMNKIEEIMAKLGASGAEAFQIVTESYARGKFALGIGCFILSLAPVLLCRSAIKQHNASKDPESQEIFALISLVVGAVVVTCWIFGVLHLSDAVSAEFRVATQLLR